MLANRVATVMLISLLVLPASAATLITSPTANPDAPVEFIEGAGGVAGIDRSGKGAVLCMWQVLVIAQATREPCGLARQPIDDELDSGIAKIDLFIVENARRNPTTLENLAAQKTSIAQEQLDGLLQYPEAREDICKAAIDFHAMPAWPVLARRLAARAMRGAVDSLISIPREPVMNPCF